MNEKTSHGSIVNRAITEARSGNLRLVRIKCPQNKAAGIMPQLDSK